MGCAAGSQPQQIYQPQQVQYQQAQFVPAGQVQFVPAGQMYFAPASQAQFAPGGHVQFAPAGYAPPAGQVQFVPGGGQQQFVQQPQLVPQQPIQMPQQGQLTASSSNKPPEYADRPLPDTDIERSLRQLLGTALHATASKLEVIKAGLISSDSEVLRLAIALAYTGSGPPQELRAAKVPPATYGVRLEYNGNAVPLDAGELRDFPIAPISIQVWVATDAIDTIKMTYANNTSQTGLDGNAVAKWGGQPQPACQMQRGEYITKISGWADDKLRSLRFHTCQGRISPDYGRNQAGKGHPFEFCAPPGTVIASFCREESVHCPKIIEAICIAHPYETDLLASGEDRLRQLCQLPYDWHIPSFCLGKGLAGATGGRKGSCVVAKQARPDLIPEVQALFDATFRKIYTRDRRGAPIADQFKVMQVYRVMNDQTWREYSGQREKIRLARWNCSSLTDQIPGGPDTLAHLAKAGSSKLPKLDSQVGEAWLFHGTSFAAAEGIAESDFRLDLSGSNAGTLYGKGIYLAENATKSDEYGEGPKGVAGEVEKEGVKPGDVQRPPPGPPPELIRYSVMLLNRAVLGKVNYNDARKPNPDQLQKSCTGDNAEFDSVLGDRRKLNKTFREYVVYHDDQVYPEFIVAYQRVFFHETFEATFRDMVQRCRSRQFSGPTPSEEKVLKSLWDVFSMPHAGKIDKWQLLDLLKAINQPPENEEADLDATFMEINKNGDGKIDWQEFLAEVIDRVGLTARS